MADAADRQLPATDKQRQRFAEKGDIARSRDLAGAALYLTGFCSLMWGGHKAAQAMLLFAHGAFAAPGKSAAGLQLWRDFMHCYARVALPLIGACAVVALITALAQNRGFQLRPLSFDLSRVNPLPRLAQLFGLSHAAGNLLWSWIKVVVLVTVCGVAVYERVPLLLHRQPNHLLGIFRSSADALVGVAWRGAVALVILGCIDYVAAYIRLERRIRMSPEDVREEHKQENGDPKIRSRRRRRYVEMTRRLSVAAVPTADVVMVNPSHYAVALSYQAHTMGAPKVVAKGADAHAERIRALARRHGVPVVAQPPLTRLLYKRVAVGKQIPQDLFHAVATVLAHVYRLRGKAA